jgi:cell division septal protein FtsQ
VTVPKERVRIVIWVRTDRYSLKRTDGKLVSDPSVVLNKTHIVNDSFPAIASNAPAAPAITS